MKEEIKEILNYLAFLEDIDTQKKVKKVADYITNLQEKTDRLNNGCKELEQQIDELHKLETTLTNENERLNNIINETRRILGEYRHYLLPDEQQNDKNEAIVDEAYNQLHSNLKELKEGK